MRKQTLAFAVLPLLALLASACGGRQVVVVTHEVTEPAALARKPAARPLSETALVAKVRSGIVRIETTTCSGVEIGTGILISPTLIATVEHVVDGAASISLVQDGKIVGHGTTVGADNARDVALIRSDEPIRGYHFHFAALQPALGENVTAIGFPLGLPLTITRGSVSGLDRTVPINGIDRSHLVQTDAPLNPGNSGGPLMASTGAVLGLVDLGISQANGLAFAVSAQVVGPLISAWQTVPQPLGFSSCSSPAVPVVTPPAPASNGRAATVATAIYTYWALIQLQNYAAAFNYLTPAEQASFGGLNKFLSYFRSDPTLSVNVRVNVTSVTANSANAEVVTLRTIGAQSGCRDWTGSYSMAYEQSRWLISYANLSYTSC